MNKLLLFIRWKQSQKRQQTQSHQLAECDKRFQTLLQQITGSAESVQQMTLPPTQSGEEPVSLADLNASLVDLEQVYAAQVARENDEQQQLRHRKERIKAEADDTIAWLQRLRRDFHNWEREQIQIGSLLECFRITPKFMPRVVFIIDGTQDEAMFERSCIFVRGIVDFVLPWLPIVQYAAVICGDSKSGDHLNYRSRIEAVRYETEVVRYTESQAFIDKLTQTRRTERVDAACALEVALTQVVDDILPLEPPSDLPVYNWVFLIGEAPPHPPRQPMQGLPIHREGQRETLFQTSRYNFVADARRLSVALRDNGTFISIRSRYGTGESYAEQVWRYITQIVTSDDQAEYLVSSLDRSCARIFADQIVASAQLTANQSKQQEV